MYNQRFKDGIFIFIIFIQSWIDFQLTQSIVYLPTIRHDVIIHNQLTPLTIKKIQNITKQVITLIDCSFRYFLLFLTITIYNSINYKRCKGKRLT